MSTTRSRQEPRRTPARIRRGAAPGAGARPLSSLALVGLIVAPTVGCAESSGDAPPGSPPREEVSAPSVAPEAPGIEPFPGTTRMAAELDSIYREALLDPLTYGHLNRERAERWRGRVERTEGSERDVARYTYGYESLAAGDTETAIRELETLMEETGLGGEVTSQSKPLWDLLGIAYLRLGEERSRARNGAGASILPYENAVHDDPEAAGRAAEIFSGVLGTFRGDLQARWLLNLAHLGMGTYPEGVPPDYLVPGLEPDPGTDVPRFPNVAPELGVAVDGIAGGISLEDFDGDGFIDILATARGFADQVRLFLADGRGGFVDHTRASGLEGLVGGLNTAHADYDNDGLVDVFLVRGGWLAQYGTHPNSLLRNRGDGVFEDVTAEAGLHTHRPSQTAAWADFDLDGRLDLFVGNETGPTGGGPGTSELYRNLGDGTFAEISEQVGIRVQAFVKAVAWGDVNDDGLPDLYLSIFDRPNLLFLNRGGTSPDDWRFEEGAAAAGVEEPVRSFPVVFRDYDNDGLEDLFVAGFDPAYAQTAPGETAAQYLGRRTRAERNRLYRNNGDGTFTNVAPEVGLDLALWAMGINVGDLNNDGYPDIYVGTGTPFPGSIMPNRMFLNDAGRAFRDITFEGGFGHLQKGHGIAFADLDRDGDQDIYAEMGGAVQGDHFPDALFENPGFGAENAWVTLRLEGRAANRSAIGARIRVRVTDANGAARSIHTTVSTGGSFGASSLQQEIGLGRADRIDELRIVWPDRDRSTDTFTDLETNRTYRIVQGEAPVPVVDDPVELGGRRTGD